MHVEMRKVADIKPYPQNARHNDHAVEAFAASIRKFGFRQPLVVDANSVVVVGATRYKAGITERTAFRRLAEPAFQARLEELRREALVRTSGMLTGAALWGSENAGRFATRCLGACCRAAWGGSGCPGDER